MNEPTLPLLYRAAAGLRCGMILEVLPGDFSACKVKDTTRIDWEAEFSFFAKTDEEYSLICRTEDLPDNTTVREDGWKAFRIAGELDFSLIGILSAITGILAQEGIQILAVSTYNTDYVFVKREKLGQALVALGKAGYELESAGDEG